jgi:hypothetical protein
MPPKKASATGVAALQPLDPNQETLSLREARSVAEPPELFQLKCLSHAPGVVTHLNRNNPSVPQI